MKTTHLHHSPSCCINQVPKDWTHFFRIENRLMCALQKPYDNIKHKSCHDRQKQSIVKYKKIRTFLKADSNQNTESYHGEWREIV